MTFRVSGLYSGLDTDLIVAQLMAIERRPLQLLEQRQRTYELRKELWDEISSSLAALKDALAKLKTPETVLPYKVTSSDAAVATGAVTAVTRVVPGTYTLKIEQLATAHQVWGDQKAGWTAGQAPDLTLTFDITVDGVTTTATITAEATDTLQDIARRINGANLGIRATVIDNRLYLEHDRTGTGNTIAVRDTGLARDLGLVDPATGQVKYQRLPQNAILYINDLPVTSQSNTLKDVISGLEVTLLKAGPDPSSPATVTLTVAQDLDAAVANIKAWVDKYNATLDLITTRLQEQTVQNPTTDADRKKGLLRGDFLLSNLKSRLRQAVSNPVTANPPLAYDRLSAIGITTSGADRGLSGKLEIDETKLRNALATNPEAVLALFNQETDVDGNGTVTADEQGIAVRLLRELEAYIASGTRTVGGITVRAGLIPARLDELQRVIDDYERRIEAFERVLDQREQSLYRQFTAMEMALSSLQNQATYLAQQLISWMQ
ncbi:MAG: flagellar filament capping protein FliD [Bacillota bacterium]|nr:MAG: hypothetical protein DIU70_10620 [Bacillota bacterium]